MRHKIEIRIVNVTFPRFIIVDRCQFWTGRGWSLRLSDALLYADADVLRDDLEKLKMIYY